MQQLQQLAKAGGDIAPLAKALPEDAKAVANAELQNNMSAEKQLQKNLQDLKKL